MEDLPFPWCIYEEYQSKAARCGRITDRTWGIENCLTHFLAVVESSNVPGNQEEFERNIGRAMATGSWVERNRARLRRKYLCHDAAPHAERRMLARAGLAEIRRSVSAAEWKLLIAVAGGFACHEVAAGPGIASGAIRTRISRLRARLRPVPRSTSRPLGGFAA